jgi:hypothetical protein
VQFGCLLFAGLLVARAVLNLTIFAAVFYEPAALAEHLALLFATVGTNWGHFVCTVYLFAFVLVLYFVYLSLQVSRRVILHRLLHHQLHRSYRTVRCFCCLICSLFTCQSELIVTSFETQYTFHQKVKNNRGRFDASL